LLEEAVAVLASMQYQTVVVVVLAVIVVRFLVKILAVVQVLKHQ
jgi:hypothetical protein